MKKESLEEEFAGPKTIWRLGDKRRPATVAREAAFMAAGGIGTVVCRLPANPSAAWWHNYIWSTTAQKPLKGVEVRFFPGEKKAVVIFHRRKR